MGSAAGSSIEVAPRRERTPFTTPLVTGSSEENESVSSERSSWLLLEARLAASAPKMDWCRLLQHRKISLGFTTCTLGCSPVEKVHRRGAGEEGRSESRSATDLAEAEFWLALPSRETVNLLVTTCYYQATHTTCRATSATSDDRPTPWRRAALSAREV